MHITLHHSSCTPSLSTPPRASLHSPLLLIPGISFTFYPPSLSSTPLHAHPPSLCALTSSIPPDAPLTPLPLTSSLPHPLTPHFLALHFLTRRSSLPRIPHLTSFLLPHPHFFTPHPSPLTSSPSSLTSSPITPSPFPFSPSLHRQALPWSSANGRSLPHTLLGFCSPRHFPDCPLPTAPGSLHDVVRPPHLHPPPLRHTSLCCLGYHTLDLHGMN